MASLLKIFNQCLQYSTHGGFPLDEGQLLIESSNFQPSRNLIYNLHLQLPDTNYQHGNAVWPPLNIQSMLVISYKEVFRWRKNSFPVNRCNIPCGLHICGAFQKSDLPPNIIYICNAQRPATAWQRCMASLEYSIQYSQPSTWRFPIGG